MSKKTQARKALCMDKSPARDRPPSKMVTGPNKAAPFKQVPQTDLDKFHVLRFKLEASEKAFIRARQQLEEIVSPEGSNELRRFLATPEESADLRTELERYSELTSRTAEASFNRNDAHQNTFQGGIQAGSSYEFLKSITG